MGEKAFIRAGGVRHPAKKRQQKGKGAGDRSFHSGAGAWTKVDQ